MMEERGRGGVVQDFQSRGGDPAKQVISGRFRRDETAPGGVVSIEVSKDKVSKNKIRISTLWSIDSNWTLRQVILKTSETLFCIRRYPDRNSAFTGSA